MTPGGHRVNVHGMMSVRSKDLINMSQDRHHSDSRSPKEEEKKRADSLEFEGASNSLSRSMKPPLS